MFSGAILKSRTGQTAERSCLAPFQRNTELTSLMSTAQRAPEKFQIILVEDHPMFREQLTHLISKESDMYVCGEADNVHDAWRLLESNPADIIIVDLTLKGPSGLELLKDLKA